jgi:hypothetical protein
MTAKDRSRDNTDTNQQAGDQETPDNRSTELRDSPMMARLLDALERGEDVGHYGRLTFAMVARFFIDEDRLIALLAEQPEQSEADARALVRQMREHDYNPPTRDRILEWQQLQDFQICQDADDPNTCNVYKELRFPDEVYDRIGAYYEEKAEAEVHGEQANS